MVLSKSTATILLQLSQGEKAPASKLKGPLIAELLAEGIIAAIRTGRTKSLLYAPSVESLNAFLTNRFSISNLQNYIDTLSQDTITRTSLVQAAANSKVKRVRTFTGFLVNSFDPVQVTLNGQPIEINPPAGSFQFIHDTRQFIPHPDVTIVSVENAENFSQIEKQRHLFKNIQPLFVSRYPPNQSRDLIKWLLGIKNPHLYYGDFDFAGIGIYLNEYRCHLGERSSFFVPDNIESLIKNWGNRDLYDRQHINFNIDKITDPKIHELIDFLHHYKRGLEQEILIK